MVREWSVKLLAVFVTATSLIALAGYAIREMSMASWGEPTPISVPAAVSMVAVGLCLYLLADKR